MDKSKDKGESKVRIVDKSSVVADTIHGQITISSFEKDVMATTFFNRLHGIHQNSTAYMTFPTNRTKRVEHSFGTMYLCGNIFSYAICNASDEDKLIFFQKASAKISEIIQSIQKNENYSPKLGGLMKKARTNYDRLEVRGGIYDRVTPGNLESEQQKIFLIMFEAIRISALLHDVGHPPFSHITEFALKNVYERIKEESLENDTVREFKDIMSGFFEEKGDLHEQMGNSIAEALLKDAVVTIKEEEAKDDLIYNRQLFRLIVGEMALCILKEKEIFYKDLHSIISGTLDGDRLDYVNRDAINSGFSVGLIEYERLISSMQLNRKKVNGQEHFIFCPCTSVINTVEDFLLRRWNLYCNIIYHHHVVKTDYLLQRSIEEIAYGYLKEDKDQCPADKGDDSCHYILPYDISGIWKAIQYQASSLERGYSVIQWDDAWLTTVLKKEFFEKRVDETSALNKMLTELLTNKRRYASIIKRKESFGVIDKSVAQEIAKKEVEIRNAITLLKNKSIVKDKDNGVHICKEKDKEKAEKKEGFDIKNFLDEIEEVLHKSGNYSQKGDLNDNDGFLLVLIQKTLSFTTCKDILYEIIVDAAKKRYGEECFVVFKAPKTGTSKDSYIYKKYYVNPDEKVVSLNAVSDIDKILTSNLCFQPFFFLYVDIERTASKNFDFAAEREAIGALIASGVCEYLIHFINNI